MQLTLYVIALLIIIVKLGVVILVSRTLIIIMPFIKMDPLLDMFDELICNVLVDNVTNDMGKRKLRFSYPKNWERKKHSAHSATFSQPSTTSPPSAAPATSQPPATFPPPTSSQPPTTSHDQLLSTAQPPISSHDQPPTTSPPSAAPATSQPPATFPPPTSSQSPTTSHDQLLSTAQPPISSHDQPPTTSPPSATPATSQPPATLPPLISSQLPATSQPPTTLSQPLTSTFGELKASVSCMDLADWTMLPRDEQLKICKFDYSKHQPSIVCCVEVQSSLEWTLYVRSVRIEASNISALSIVPAKVFTVGDIQNLLHAIDGCVICSGNEYDTFAPLVDARSGILRDISGMLCMYMYKSIFKSGASNNSVNRWV